MEWPKIFQRKNKEEETKKVERAVEQKIAEYGEEDLEKEQERSAAVKALGAEKATAEQIYNLRREIGEEEEKQAERKAAIEALGPQKATKEQTETFAPVSEKTEQIEQEPKEPEEQLKKAA